MKDLKIYIIVASALLLFYLVAQYNKPKPVNWEPTFTKEDKIPFGTYVLYNRLQDIFPKAEVTPYRKTPYDLLTNEGINNTTYIIICDEFKLNDYDFAALKKYVSKGNDIFIAATQFGTMMENKLGVAVRSELSGNGQTFINFSNKALGDSTYILNQQITNNYFSQLDTLKTLVLGKNGYEHATFIKMPMGKGSLYLNANPGMFTNYSLLQNKGADYAAKSLSYLKIQKQIAWDEFYTKGRESGDSSMRVFLSHPQLRWAFYLLLSGLLLFVIYQSKRRQRIIPVIEPAKNASVEFVTVVGQVYYEQHDNRNIAQKKVRYFLDHLRSRYHVKTNVHDAEFLETLAQKSGVELRLIKDIFYQVAPIQHGEAVSNQELIIFNQNIEQFYSQSS